jgi:DNA-binding NarL/FixJ family response regulator
MRNTRVERTRRNLDLRRPAHAPRKPEPTLRGAGRAQQLPDPLRTTENDKAIRVLIADDHDVVRRGLRAFLDLDSGLEVVGEAGNGAQAVHLAHRLRPDVVLMDLAMPELDGIAATEVIHRELPNTSVVALTSLLEDESIVRALRAGAAGYLLKDTSATDLRQAIKPSRQQ